MLNVSQTDAQGYAIPWTADDEVIECGPDDPSWGEPESWPAWTDASHWGLGADPAPVLAGEEVELDAPDEFPAYVPSERDWEEACAMFDRMDLPPWPGDDSSHVTDRDIIAVQGGAG